MKTVEEEIALELHHLDHAPKNHFNWGRDYGKDLLTDLNMLAHTYGTDTLRRDVMERAHRKIRQLQSALQPFVDASWSPIEDTRSVSMTVPIEARRIAVVATAK